MTIMGKVVWREMCRKAGEQGIVNVLGHFSDNVLPLGPKTLLRRLNEDNWTLTELVCLQQELKSATLQEYIGEQFQRAIDS